jgi:hypothetical protein
MFKGELLVALSKRWYIVAIYSIVLVFIAFSFFMHLNNASFTRSIDEDELITLKYYTLGGIYSNGKERKIEHVSDLKKIAKPSMKQLLIGLYCSIGRWTEPNNHVFNSVLVNFTFFLKNRSEAIIRIPAFIGFVCLTFLFAYLLSSILNFKIQTILLTLPILVLNPYVIGYSVTSRGYIWMLVFQVLSIIGLYLTKLNPFSVRVAIFSVVTLTISIFNIISTLTFLVVPLYCTIIFYFLIAEKKSIFSKEFKWLTIQIIVLASLVSIFIFDRFPYIISSSNQYGVPFSTLSEFVNKFIGILSYYFPTLVWKIILALSVLGLVIGAKDKKNYFFAILFLFTFIIILAQALLSHKFGYDRVYGFIIVLTSVGFALLLESINKIKSLYLRIGLFSFIIILCCYIIKCSNFDSIDHKGKLFTTAISNISSSEDTNYIPIILDNIPKANSLYFPDNWNLNFIIKNDVNSKICFLFKKSMTNTKTRSNFKISLIDNICNHYYLDTIINLSNQYFCLEMNGVFKKYTDSLAMGLQDKTVVFFWQPPFDVVSLSPDTITSFLDTMELNYCQDNRRYYAKLEVFSRLNYVIIFPFSNTELKNVIYTINKGVDKFGGEVSVFIAKN